MHQIKSRPPHDSVQSAERYDYGTPKWAVVMLCAIAIAVSLLCFTGILYWRAWAAQAPIILRWIILLPMGLVFLVAGLKPGNWKAWRYFYADPQGIHFPSECPETGNTQWLSVPWKHVGAIKKEVFYSRYKGPSIELSLQDEEINRFFGDIKLKRLFFDKAARRDGYFKVGYSNAFMRPDDVVKVLNEFKENYT